MLKFKEVYGYDEKTFEYTGIESAQENPLILGQFLMPANSTNAKPPIKKDGYAIIWKNNQWEYIEDHRDLHYWLEKDEWNSSYRIITELGPLPTNILLKQPEKPKKILIDFFNSVRYFKLQDTDYLVMSDYPLKESIKNDILEYRQKLRDMPTWEDYPWDGGSINTPWPEIPNFK